MRFAQVIVTIVMLSIASVIGQAVVQVMTDVAWVVDHVK